ncbi:MAG: zinc-binding dehydrogenase [Thermoleophilia bacterium]|nr:zinc-binding dehydrogenase [Thermoleophilia bacterium]
MRSWQFTGTHQPLVLNEVPMPEPGPGQVTIDVKAAGLCHTDVGVLHDDGWRETLMYAPITMGHEVAGAIRAVGEGVTGWGVGDRVGVCPTTAAGAPGFSSDGGFGPVLAIGAEALVRIPDGLGFALGAAATDAGMTSYHAVISNGQVTPGDAVGIIGLGGLGQVGARVAVLAGADVYVAEVNEKAWPLADQIGAKGVMKSIRDFGDVEFDVIVDFAGFGVTTADAIETVKLGGRVVQVGMGTLEATISTKAMILRKVTYIGSNGGTPEDISALYELMSRGELVPALTEITFDEIPDGLERLRRGDVRGRLVAIYE